MSTISSVTIPNIDENICQGDIYKNVKYIFIDSENEKTYTMIEMTFPYAIIISQACDVVSMGEMIIKKNGKPNKFMTSILMCPIYDEEMFKKADHLEEAFRELGINKEQENMYTGEDRGVSKKDWHYRYHNLSLKYDDKIVLTKAVVDFKSYFCVSPKYLIEHRIDRIYRLEDLYSEQLSLKFATYLSRVAIPDEKQEINK